jgi:hypothetical protein
MPHFPVQCCPLPELVFPTHGSLARILRHKPIGTVVDQPFHPTWWRSTSTLTLPAGSARGTRRHTSATDLQLVCLTSRGDGKTLGFDLRATTPARW